MIHNVILVTAFWGMYFVILTLVWYLKERLAWTPKPYGIIDNYPFICRKCLTTWTLIASYISVGIIINNPVFAIFGVLLGAGTGYAIHQTEKERMEQ